MPVRRRVPRGPRVTQWPPSARRASKAAARAAAALTGRWPRPRPRPFRVNPMIPRAVGLQQMARALDRDSDRVY
jgi:hypothetical protein